MSDRKMKRQEGKEDARNGSIDLRNHKAASHKHFRFIHQSDGFSWMIHRFQPTRRSERFTVVTLVSRILDESSSADVFVARSRASNGRMLSVQLTGPKRPGTGYWFGPTREIGRSRPLTAKKPEQSTTESTEANVSTCSVLKGRQKNPNQQMQVNNTTLFF